MAAVARELITAGLSGDALVCALERVEQATEPKRSAGALRQERYRQRHSASQNVTGDAGHPDKEMPPAPPKEINPSEPYGSVLLAREFDEFWTVWPSKVAKKPARRAFKAARKREDLETILDGVRRYARTKPPDRNWMNPATFLNQERWNDEPDQPASPAKRTQLDRVFGALAEIGQGLDDPGGGPVDSPAGSEPDAADGGRQSGFLIEGQARLRAV